MSKIDDFYVRGGEPDVPAVEAALEAIPYDRVAIQVAVEPWDRAPVWGISVDVETFGVDAAAVVASLRDQLSSAGWDTIDRDGMYAESVRAEP